jgi:predicted dehydrogenase
MLRVGIVGVGRTAAGHARAAAAHPEAAVTSVAEIDEERGRAFAARHGLAWTADFGELCARDDVDAVVITAPNFVHAPAALAAIAAGKHVLCEKPLALTAAECAAIVGEARRAGVRLAVGHHYHHTAPTRAAREALASAELDLGRPVLAMDVWYKSFYDPPQRPAWFLDAARGGGMWPMNGSHMVDRLMFTTGRRVLAVRAQVGNPFWGHPATDAAHAFLVLEGGFTAAVAHAGWRDGVARFETEFVCERGFLRVTDREVAVGRGGAWMPRPLAPLDTFASQFAEFHAACTAGGPLSAPGEWGLEVVAVLEAAEESSRLAREVAVADVLRRAGADLTWASPARSPAP